MKPDMILQADWLDILFEHRNKEYGAYHLRRHYNARLLKALGIMLGLVTALVLLYGWGRNTADQQEAAAVVTLIDDVKLNRVEIEPARPLQPPPATAPRKIATIKNTQLVIVPNEVAADPPPPVDVLLKEEAAISTSTTPGETFTGTASPPAGTTAGMGQAVQPAITEEADRILPAADIMPEYPGGVEALRRFLGRNLRVPEEAMQNGQAVKVPIRFVINKDGNLTEVVFLTATDEAFKQEVRRVVSKMPKWKPGLQNGKAVAVYFMLPIIFQTSDE